MLSAMMQMGRVAKEALAQNSSATFKLAHYRPSIVVAMVVARFYLHASRPNHDSL